MLLVPDFSSTTPKAKSEKLFTGSRGKKITNQKFYT